MKSDLDHFEEESSRALKPMTLPLSRTGASEKGQSHSAKVDLLYRDHWTALASSLRRTFGDGPPDPDDIAQQAFQKLIEREQLSDIRSIKGFLWRTARNLMINAKRSRATRSRYDFEIEQLYFPSRGVNSTPEAVFSANQELRAINNVLRAMPEKRRRAFILHRVEGLSVSEVARRLRLSRSPTDRHIRRAAEDIQMCLSNLRNEDEE
ncbi:MAG: RNA polymerase sigma factor [Henriciella sp.]